MVCVCVTSLSLLLSCECVHATECGNDACETGEACDDDVCVSGCRVDCPVVVRSCPVGTPSSVTGARSAAACSGSGTCLPATGSCRCFNGYVGADCSLCDSRAGYMRLVSRGPCVFLPGAMSSCSDGVRSASEGGVDCGGVCEAACEAQAADATSRRALVLRLGIIGGCFAVFAASLLVIVRVRRRLTPSNSVAELKERWATLTVPAAESFSISPVQHYASVADAAHKGVTTRATTTQSSDGDSTTTATATATVTASEMSVSSSWLDRVLPRRWRGDSSTPSDESRRRRVIDMRGGAASHGGDGADDGHRSTAWRGDRGDASTVNSITGAARRTVTAASVPTKVMVRARVAASDVTVGSVAAAPPSSPVAGSGSGRSLVSTLLGGSRGSGRGGVVTQPALWPAPAVSLSPSGAGARKGGSRVKPVAESPGPSGTAQAASGAGSRGTPGPRWQESALRSRQPDVW